MLQKLFYSIFVFLPSEFSTFYIFIYLFIFERTYYGTTIYEPIPHFLWVSLPWSTSVTNTRQYQALTIFFPVSKQSPLHERLTLSTTPLQHSTILLYQATNIVLLSFEPNSHFYPKI